MTIKITTPNGGSDSLDFGCAQTLNVAAVTGTEVSSGEGKLELKTTTGGTSATKATVLANGNVGIGTTAPSAQLNLSSPNNIGGSGGTFSNAALRIGTSSSSSMYLDTNEIHGAETLNFFSNGTDNSAADYIRFATGGSGGAERMRVTSAGNVGIGTSSPTYKLQVQSGLYSILAGADSSATTLTNSTQKVMRFGVPHYINTEEPVGVLFGSITGTQSDVIIGGGTGAFNAATAISFYTAANQTTVTGTKRMEIDSAGNLKFNSGYGSAATAYGCRAWVNFNGTGTVAIRASGNVSSITDNGTGSYDVNFTVAMVDANYVCNVNASTATDAGNLNPPAGMDRTTAKVRIDVEASGGSQYNAAQIDVTIVR